MAGYPLDHPFTAGAARLDIAESAIGPNIYQTSQVRRQIYPIRALVRPGNSGGPLLAPDGQVYGVVFAAAVSLKSTGYALTASEVSGDAARGGTPPPRYPPAPARARPPPTGPPPSTGVVRIAGR